MKKNVARFDISMHNIWFGQKLESFEQIVEVIHCLFLTKSTFILDLLFKSSSIAILIDKVVVVCCFKNLDKADNVRGVLYFGKSLYLIDGELLKFWTWFKFLNFDDFDCYCLVGFFVDCPVYFSELTLPNNII